MPDHFEAERTWRLEEVEALLATEQAPARFARELFRNGAAEDLAAYEPGQLAEIARRALDFFAVRTERTALRIADVPPAAGGAARQTAIEILTTDRPFIFDSVIGEIQAAGHAVELVLHPVFEVTRDGEGRLQQYSASRRGVVSHLPRESFIHLHVGLIRSEEARAALLERLRSLLVEVHLATDDWRAMRERLRNAILEFRVDPPALPEAEIEEAIAFLEWLEDDNFTFLGMRRYAYGAIGSEAAEADTEGGLGLLRDPGVRVLRRGAELVTMTPEIREFLSAPEPLIITKANVKSRVHRRDYMDYVGVKLFEDRERVVGELRIVGLFTSSAFTQSVERIPILRRKTENILQHAGFDPVSHSGKALLNILESYPRTELFQADTETLYRSAMTVLELHERPRIRVIERRDRFERFVSVLVYVPRDRYSSDIRTRVGAAVAELYGGHISAAFPAFPELGLARVQYIVGLEKTGQPVPDRLEVEAAIEAIVRTFEDDLAEALEAAYPPDEAARLLALYGRAFGGGYRASYSAAQAVSDIAVLEDLRGETAISGRFRSDPADAENRIRLRLHHRGSPVPLSRRVPLLENLGFSVIDERTYRLTPEGSEPVYLHDMMLARDDGTPVPDAAAERLREAVLAVWADRADNDGFNRLVLAAGLDWREAALLRGIGRYLRQTELPYSIDYLWTTLAARADIAALLVRRFAARFDPGIGDREGAEAAAEKALDAALDTITGIDEDTILRGYAQVIRATLRTDFFVRDAAGSPPGPISFKVAPHQLPFVPRPRPYREIFVHAPQVDGLHMRFGPIARGGIRWSDRPQDFRTEVLGLVKAQQVKNAVIVPVGAKGGFVPLRLPSGAGRDAIFQAGQDAYVSFIDRLLALTDNLEGGRVVPPAGIVRHDGDDPYLVVAADKGTATFSDTANRLAAGHDFWLGDAFASGGSAGYDHKAMGITARGAWEAVKRHFREMDVDIQAEPFTVAGIGDMSGDVFGNGMLLSRAIRLVAAFDHRDIFIDPDPDCAASFAERERLFGMPRSSWQDYDRTVLSKGGGIYSRRAKEIELSPEAALLLGFANPHQRPQAVMRAILEAPVDLLWFGGIGTYVRAPDEPDSAVGDKANDAIRITADALRAKVVGEGANLGMTQRARIAYGLSGGRCNSDAIDNSGGVNSSDLEVNIKIALAPAVRSGRLAMPARNALLESMTAEVAALVLRNNYQQTLAISLESARGLDNLSFQARFMSSLEAEGVLDRTVEALPDALAIEERRAAREPLTRAEIGTLLAYAKIELFNELVGSDVPDDPYLGRELSRYFPERMRQDFAAEIAGHRLRREIIATQLANSIANRGGPTLVVRLRDRIGASAADLARGFAAARDSFRLQELHARIDALDNCISGALQLELYRIVQDVTVERIVWFIRHVDRSTGLAEVVAHYQTALAALAPLIPPLLSPAPANLLKSWAERFTAGGVPADLSSEIALLSHLAAASDIVLVARDTGRDLAAAAGAYYGVAAHLGLGEVEAMLAGVEARDYYEGLALDQAADTLAGAHRTLARQVLAAGPSADLARWEQARGPKVGQSLAHLRSMIADGRPSAAKATVMASLVAEIASAPGQAEPGAASGT
ncbi:NAD-glutamate dehydrogenase [Propylenella binzhouense]|uniref:NAD-glutamate dehydrogenase n=1 Tax=Propylenella binzhouense TaxID=2555902 RepID=UPI0031B57351